MTLPLTQSETDVKAQVMSSQEIVEISEKEPEPSSMEGKESNEPIGSVLSGLTQSLNLLTRTVANMSANMVSKSDIVELKNVMHDQGSQIVENTEKIKVLMPLSEGKKLEKKLKDHDSILKSQSDNVTRLEDKIGELNAQMLKHDENVPKTSKRIDGIADMTTKLKLNIEIELDEIKKAMREQSAEIQMLKNGQRVNTAPVTDQHVGSDQRGRFDMSQQGQKLNVIIEGLAESEDENLPEKITKLCEKLGVKINPSDIGSAWRLIRRVPLGNKPNPVKVCLTNFNVKERIMKSKSTLNENPDMQHIWINHDETTAVRRAKGRARFITSYSRKKGSQVQITPRGIVLDNVFYTYDNLDRIPSIYIPPTSLQLPVHTGATNEKHRPNNTEVVNKAINQDEVPVTPRRSQRPIDLLQPMPIATNVRQSPPKVPRTKKPQKMRLTRSGLVYSGPSAIFSHLYKANFTIDDTPYNSVEQKLQYEKAMMAHDMQSAETIMNTSDTWKIKQIGDRVKVTKEYIDNRLHIARVGNEAKFRDNPDLMEVLLDTGELILIEGANSSFWAGGESFDSEAYDNEDAHGKNHQGEMLMNLRTNERTRRAGIALR